MKNYYLPVVLCISVMLFNIPANAQTNKDFVDAIRNLMDASFQSDSLELEKSLQELEGFIKIKDIAHLAYYYLGFGKWQSVMRLGNSAMSNENATRLIHSAIDDLQKSVEIKEDFADAYILSVNCYFALYYMEPGGRTEFIKSASTAKKTALELDPQNPRVILTDAQNIFYTPEQFGGSQEKGIARYKEAIEIFEKEKTELPLPNWGHEVAYGWMGNAYFSLKDPNLLKAKEAFDKSLMLRPDFSWVKDTMLPQVEKQITDFLKESNLK